MKDTSRYLILGVIGGIFVVAVAIILLSNSTANNSVQDQMQKQDSMINKQDDAMKQDDQMQKDQNAKMEKDDQMMEQDNNQMQKDDSSMMQKGTYVAYSEKALTDQTNILFFAASWCPTCRALDTDINANVSSIPAGVTIFKTDYDAEVALKQKYGVTYQHTLVQVDTDGNMIKKWNGSPTLDSLLEQI